MIYFDSAFIKTKYEGYLWNYKEKVLYTLKVTGKLRPMKFQKGGTFNNHVVPPGYKVSVDGQRRYLPIEHLLKLKPSIIPTKY